MPYSIPAIRFEDNGKALESSKIVHELEKRYPTPSPKINDEVVQEVVDAVIQCMRNGPDVLPKVPRVLLDPKSAEYFEQSRSQKFGMSLDQLQKEKGGSSWDEAELGFKRATELLKENRDGPYFMGKKGNTFCIYLQANCSLRRSILCRLCVRVSLEVLGTSGPKHV